MVKDTAVPTGNKKFNMEKTDKEKDKKPDRERAGRKTGFFVPKKVETGKEIKSGTRTSRKPEKTDPEASAGKGQKSELRPETKTGKIHYYREKYCHSQRTIN